MRCSGCYGLREDNERFFTTAKKLLVFLQRALSITTPTNALVYLIGSNY